MKEDRIFLAIFSSALSVLLGVFVWIMLNASSYVMSSVLLGSLSLIVGVTIIAQIIYALKGQIFEFDGRLAKQEILFAIICFQVVMQFSFGFSIYAVKQTELQNASFDDAYAWFVELQQSAPDNTIEAFLSLNLETNMPECVESVMVVSGDNIINVNQYFQFPISGGRLLMQRSQQYYNRHLRDFAFSLIMSLVISVLLMAEMVFLAIKYIGNRGDKAAVCPSEYLRQVAFLFYFAGFLGASFVPIIARNFVSGNPNADFIAGLPYSVEALANCVAILFATRFFRKEGWKPPYFTGVLLFFTGLITSAFSPNIFAFIASRALTGVGYGFCWMTLRNAATLSGDRVERFSGLFSGIYAGIMCGVAFGAMLADIIGYNSVLLVSAALTVAAAIFPMTLKNKSCVPDVANNGKVRVSLKDMVIFIVFLVLIVIPTCISDAFCGYVLPLYTNNLELPTAYIGRVSLIYNLCLVYISSTVIIKLVKKLIKNTLFQNAVHMIFISLALLAAAFLGGFQAMIVAAMLLGFVDGFGFAVQNSYILDTQVCKRIGTARMLTYFSLFKKFGAMLGPLVFGLFIMNGFQRLGIMAFIFFICAITGLAVIMFMQKGKSVQ